MNWNKNIIVENWHYQLIFCNTKQYVKLHSHVQQIMSEPPSTVLLGVKDKIKDGDL